MRKKKPAGDGDAKPPRSADPRLSHFDSLESLVLEKLIARGWTVGVNSVIDPDAHFWGIGDWVVPKTSTANRAYRAAERGQPIPAPSEPEWYSVFLIDEETGTEFFQAWEEASIEGTLNVEIVERGPDYRIEQANSRTPPPGHGWVLYERALHPSFKSRWRRVRRMVWA